MRLVKREFKKALTFLFYSQLSTEETAQLSKDVFIMKVHLHFWPI